MRRASAIDANQPEIVKALRAVGASVAVLSGCGNGIPDLLVGYRRQTHLLELKDSAKPPSARQLTPDQKRWHATWAGRPVHVVLTVDEALAAVGVVPVAYGCPRCASGSLDHSERCLCVCHPGATP